MPPLSLSEGTMNDIDNTNALSLLADNFDKMTKLKISFTLAKHGLNLDLYCPPLTFEETASFSKMVDESGSLIVAKACSFLVSKVETETGEKAFRNCRNKPAAQVLKDNVDSKIVTRIFQEITAWAKADADEAATIAGK
jgi:hypothetical protein